MRFFLLGFFLLVAMPLFGSAQVWVSPSSLVLGEILAEIRQNHLELWVRIPPGAHLYSIYVDPELGPQPTRLFLSPGVEVPKEDLTESKAKKILDQAFGIELLAHEREMRLRASFSKNLQGPVTGYLLYQICDQFICSLPQKSAFTTTR